jgi:hypothetical protein
MILTEIPYFLNVSHTSLPPCLPFYGSATGTGVRCNSIENIARQIETQQAEGAY